MVAISEVMMADVWWRRSGIGIGYQNNPESSVHKRHGAHNSTAKTVTYFLPQEVPPSASEVVETDPSVHKEAENSCRWYRKLGRSRDRLTFGDFCRRITSVGRWFIISHCCFCCCCWTDNDV